jgi:flagella basal body P-ring formation protein FlgA
MTMKNLWLALLVALLLGASTAQAAPQNHTKIREVALAYLQTQTQSLPGKVSLRVGDIDSRTVLRACTALEAFMPGGAQLIGKTSIGVRCNEKPGWSVFVQADIRVSADMLVANRPLAQNTVLSANDFSLQNGELGQPGILIDPAQAIGKTLKFGIGAGQVLRQDMLRAPYVVMQGQTATVRVSSKGFSVRSSGQALNSGADGQGVQVRMASGQVISGIAATDGCVDVRP